MDEPVLRMVQDIAYWMVALLAVVGLPYWMITAARNGKAAQPGPSMRLMLLGLGWLAALFVPTALIVGDAFGGLPQFLEYVLELGLLVLPCAGLLLAALLLRAALIDNTVGPDWASLLAVVLGGALLLKSLHNLTGLLAWDQTYDPIGIFYLMLAGWFALVSAGVLLVDLPGPRKLLGAMLALGLPALLFAMGLDAERIDIYQRTEQNAQRVTAVLEAYHAREGGYPARLDQLGPGFALSHPRPWIIYGQDWCYQGGAGGYRLGYVFRDHWSSPELAAVQYAQQGSPPGAGLCADEIAALERANPFYLLRR